MKKVLYLYSILCLSICCITFSACTHTSDVAVKKRFPSTFLEKGNDSDYSYHSLKSSRLDNDHLKLELTGWAGEGTGIFLLDFVKDNDLVLNVLGECATDADMPGHEPPVSISVKRTFVYTVSNTLEDSLNFIRLREIELGKQ